MHCTSKLWLCPTAPIPVTPVTPRAINRKSQTIPDKSRHINVRRLMLWIEMREKANYIIQRNLTFDVLATILI